MLAGVPPGAELPRAVALRVVEEGDQRAPVCHYIRIPVLQETGEVLESTAVGLVPTDLVVARRGGVARQYRPVHLGVGRRLVIRLTVVV